MSLLARLRPDTFTTALIGVVLLATVLPATGAFAEVWHVATQIAIALLFFLHGARLSRQAVLAGLTHWRLHLIVIGFTFLVFPALGVGFAQLPEAILPGGLALGLIFLCCLPSTVQSSIAFTSIAGGNVAAAVCSASASSLFGVAFTPLLVSLLMSASGDAISLQQVEAIFTQILLPFVVGQIVHPWVGAWALRNKKVLSVFDRGSILMVVYGAFSEAVINGLWRQLNPTASIVLVLVCSALLAILLTATTWTARRLGFNRADEITIVFCGSKKSLAAGVPMANILFPAASVGMIVLPLMVFHQIQLMVCAVLARRYARQTASAAPKPEAT
jgi:solute carrier family 10 (sodium/bile acid cotransporter), member 7